MGTRGSARVQEDVDVRSTRSTPRKAAAAAAAAAAAKPSARDAKSRPSVPASPVAAAGSKRKLETTSRGVSKRAAAGEDSPVKVKAEVKRASCTGLWAALTTKATPGHVKKEPTTAETKSAAAGKGRARPRRGATALRGTRAAKLEPVKGEEASESEESDDDTPVPENEYEAKRRANMERNRAILESLSIPEIPVMERPAAAAPVRARGLGKKAPPERPPPRARSMRLQGLTSEGEKLPDNWREPLRFKPSEAEREEWRDRRTGKLALTECAAPDPRAADQEQAKADALAHLDSFATRWAGVDDNPAAARGNSAAAGAKAGAAFAAEMRKLQVGENDVAKVVPDRIYAMAFHPSEQHTLVAAADKCGRIGLFAPDWADDDSCVMHMQVHSRAVTSLYFDQQAPAALYSSGYDCLVRRLDLEKRVWDEVAQFDEDDMKFLSTSMLHAGQRAMYCGMGTGQLAVSDLRARAKPVLYQLHDKTIRAVDVSPGDPNLLLTGSIDTTVALWDARKLKGKPLASWEHGRGVTSARFSPASGSVAISASFDDTIRVFDIKSRTQTHSIRHNNQTGRWLTSFQAAFDPAGDDAFVIGSMEQPRGVDLFSARGGSKIARLSSPAFACVCSLYAWHPSRRMFAGGNSSGKVYLWR